MTLMRTHTRLHTHTYKTRNIQILIIIIYEGAKTRKTYHDTEPVSRILSWHREDNKSNFSLKFSSSIILWNILTILENKDCWNSLCSLWAAECFFLNTSNPPYNSTNLSLLQQHVNLKVVLKDILIKMQTAQYIWKII